MLPKLICETLNIHPIIALLPDAWLKNMSPHYNKKNKDDLITVFEDYKKKHSSEIFQYLNISVELIGARNSDTDKDTANNLVIALLLKVNKIQGLDSALANIKPEYIQQAITCFSFLFTRETLPQTIVNLSHALNNYPEQTQIAKNTIQLLKQLEINYPHNLCLNITFIEHEKLLLVQLISIARYPYQRKNTVLALMQLLIDNYPNLNINAKESQTITPLTQAVRSCDMDILRLLLRNPIIKLNTNVQESYTDEPIILEAIKSYRLDMPKVLLYYGATVTSYEESFIIEWAENNEMPEIIQLIQEHKVVNQSFLHVYPSHNILPLKRDYHIKFNEYLRPDSLHLAVKEANLQKITLILNANANVYFKNRAGESAFQLICQSENSDLIQCVFNVLLNKVRSTTDTAIEEKYADLIIDMQETISANYLFKDLFPDEQDFKFLNKTFKFIFQKKIQDQISSIEKNTKNLFFYRTERKTEHLRKLLDIIEQTTINELATKVGQWKNKKLIRTDTTNKESSQQITVEELMNENLCLFSFQKSKTKSTQCITNIENRLSRLGFGEAI